ncbi:MAG: BatD family protein, partial [Kiritimatiellota bacterium]|nr:BatD family protein [Kiritimatiellota bacterium]
ILIWMALSLTASLPLVAEDVTVNVEANRNQLYLGESFILQVNVSGANEAEPDLSQIKNSKVRSLGKQKISNVSISFVNGQVTRQGFSGLIISYEITPLTAGPFQAGPVAVTVNGRRLTAAGPSLTVTDIEKQDLVSLAITSSSETVLIDEPFDITLTVLIKRLTGRFANAEPLFPDTPPILTIPWLTIEGIPGLNGPDINQLLNKLLIPNNRPGFAINDYTRQPDPFDFSSFMAGGKRRALFALDRRLTRLAGAKRSGGAWQNGTDYVEYSLTLPYTPIDEGNYVFGPVVFKGSVPVAMATPVETDDTGKAHGMAIFAVGPACTVRVIPPPELDRPTCFSGAIGSNLTVRASLDATTCSVGDPLKLTLELSGRVRFDKMLPPKLALQTNLLEHFTIYDNTVQTVKQDTACRYIYTLRPKHAGAFQVPPIEVAYYDVKSRGYKTIATQMIPLSIKRGSEVTASQILGNTNRMQTTAMKDDDRTQPIAVARADAAGACSASLFGHPAWLAVAGAGPGLFLISLMIRFYRKHNKKHRAALRRQQAMPHALQRLSKAIELSRQRRQLFHVAAAVTPWPPKESTPLPARLPGLQDSAAADELCAAIRHYIAERLGVPAAGITPEDARHLLAAVATGAPDDPAEELCRLFEHYFNAGFSTRTELKDLSTDCRNLKKLIHEIDDVLRSRDKRNNRVRASFLLVLTTGSLVLFSCAPASALDASERAFIWHEGYARMAAARTPAAYLRAAQTYQKLVDAGVRNGPLFYNLGTALLQAGQIDPAIDAFQRAEQFLGAQGDIRQNLEIAMARKADNETAEWPWYRLVLFWHFNLPAATRMMAAAIAFFIFWAALTLRLAGIQRNGVNAILILAAITVILFGSSVATSWQQEATAPAYPLPQLSAPR